LPSAPPTAHGTLLGLLNGYRGSQALHVAAVLGVPDLLANGPRPSSELAEATGAQPETLYRLLRALAALGVLEEASDRTFTLTEVGRLLRSDVEGSLHGWAVFIGSETHWRSWERLDHSVQSGETAFDHLYGVDVWTYRAEHPDEGAVFDAAMASLTSGLERALLEAYDFGRFHRIVDVGGNRGELLAAILAAHGDLHGVVFDLPHVVTAAASNLTAAGIAERAEAVGGSFFDGVPAGGDAYLLKAIIHDWDDERATAILRRCAEAMNENGTVLVIEHDLGAPNEDPIPKLGDLQMLVAPGGRERSREEYAALFETAGLRMSDVVPVRGGWAIFEARR
jgi:O-methyltransferase/methyltransferase family protein